MKRSIVLSPRREAQSRRQAWEELPRIEADQPLVVERPLYFLYRGVWEGGHDVVGALEPAREWYFAEGCTRD
ncbi:MAG: hypothetical protein KKE79_08630, partial [Actinobacteria bacterium]|nr:hypothetical protein [Actinomycetota bacterium]